MKRIASITIFIFALLILFPGATKSFADDSAKRVIFTNPVIKHSTPDPSIIRAADGFFYLYGTEDTHNMPIYRSKNLVDWVYVGTAFNDVTRPKCVTNTNAMMWAPDINYINGQYVLYYAIGAWGQGWKCGVGVATSDQPEGPFADRGVMFYSTDVNVNNSIDQFFINDNGKNYMIWGSFSGIYAIQLSDDGLTLMPGASKTQIAGTMMEASYVCKHNGYYYLFGSNGSCCDGASSTYKVIYGRSTSLLGPYVNKSGGKMLDGSYDILLQGNSIVAGPDTMPNLL